MSGYVRDLRTAVAVVTGGGAGIGRATARSLAARGCAVAVLDVRGDRAESVRDEVEADGGRAIAVECDARCPRELDQARTTVLERFGEVDVLVCGGAEHDEAFEAGVVPVLQGVRAFVPAMVARGSGHVVTAGPGGHPFADAALIGLTYSLHQYLEPRGVGVTYVSPSQRPRDVGELVVDGGLLGGAPLLTSRAEALDRLRALAEPHP